MTHNTRVLLLVYGSLMLPAVICAVLAYVHG